MNAVSYFIASVVLRWMYNLFVFFYHGFTPVQKGILHLLLAIVSALFAWLALRMFRRSSPSGSNLGCFFLVLLYLNVIGSFGAICFALVQFFAVDSGGPETLWLL